MESCKRKRYVFAVIRLGYRGYGEEGKLVLDAKFEQNIEGAQKAGLKTGVYFSPQAVSDTEAKEEAAFVLAQLEGKKLELPVVFDTEEIKGDTARTDGNTREQYTENCKVFCEEIEDAGYDTMIYANMKWIAFTLYMERLTEYDIWYADYEAKPQCPYAFFYVAVFRDRSSAGSEGNVDLNIWFQEEEKMKWNKFRLKTTTQAEDIVSSMLMDLGIQGGEIEDKIPLSQSDKGADVRRYPAGNRGGRRDGVFELLSGRGRREGSRFLPV